MPFNSGIFIDLFIYLCIYLQLSLFKGIVETNSLLEACSPLVNCYSAKAIPGLQKKQVSQCQNIYEHAIWYVKSNIKTACYFLLQWSPRLYLVTACIAWARYLLLVDDTPAIEIRPSRVRYTEWSFFILSTCQKTVLK